MNKPTIRAFVPAALVGALLSAGWRSTEAGAPVHFTDATVAWGLGAHQPEMGHGTGVAVADYDGDGLVDLFVPQKAGVADLLYRNLGGAFEEIGTQAGVGSTASSRAALWVDYDGDGDLDLWVANDDQAAASSYTLYRQDAAHAFSDVTREAGLSRPPIVPDPLKFHWAGLCAGDVDRDGDVDLYTAQWFGPAHLLRNLGDGTYEDVSETSGVASLHRHAHQCAMHDFDGDGWLDIYQAIDFDENLLWVNQRDGTFVNQAPAAGMANSMNDMGVTLGDYDGDGDFDVYVTNVFIEEGQPNGPRYNILLRDDSTEVAGLRFTEVSEEMGVREGWWGWGTTFLDCDNDGSLDLAATNGWREGVWVDDPTRLFHNPDRGAAPFQDIARAAGFDDTYWGSGLIAADFDRDGDLDVVQATMDGPIRLVESDAAQRGAGNYLVVQPRGAGANRFAIGAIVRVRRGDGTTLVRRISAGTSYLAQEPYEAFFGVGADTVLPWVEVVWPQGSVTTRQNVDANQVLVVTAPFFEDGFESGMTDAWDGVAE